MGSPGTTRTRTRRADPDALAQAALVAAALAQLPATALGAAGRAGTPGVAELSDSFDVAVVPAGYAFAVWGPIYAGSLALAGYQALPAHRGDPLLRRVRLPAAAAYAGNAVWILAFTHRRYRLALGCILTTLAGSTAAYARTSTAGAPAGHPDRTRPLDPAHAWLVRAPLGLLAGWIAVATPSAVAVTLLAAGRDRVGPGAGLDGAGWAPSLLAALAGVTAAVTRLLPGSLTYPAAVTWGLAGVAANPRVPATARGTAALAAAVTAAAATGGRA